MSTTRSHSFAKGLFFGDIREDLLFPYPRLPRNEQEQVAGLLRDLVRLAGEVIDPRRIDREARIPDETLAALGRLGVFGLSVPGELGGLGLSMTGTCRVLDQLGALDGGVAVTVAAHVGLCVSALLQYGTPEQKRRYLPRLCRGESLGAFALTEATAGSDAVACRTRAEAEAEGFVLSGTKLWVLNGGRAELFLTFAQTQVLREGAQADRLTGFLVERGPGLTAGAEESKLGVRGASTTALYLHELKVPRSQILGALGNGQKVAMETLSRGRLLFGAACLGSARELLRLSVQHATSRRQFGRLLSTLGMIKDKIARQAVDLYALESTLYLTSGLLDARWHRGGETDCSLEAAICKVMASETLDRAARTALQIAAGCGFRTDYPYERMLRDSHAHLLFPGTNEVLRCYIALTGLHGPSEQLDKLADAIKYPLRGYGLVVESLFEKVRHATYGRAQILHHHPRLKKEAVFIEDTVEQLAREVDRVLRRHGRVISEMQYVQRRVADVVIDLYAMCASVARASAALVARDARYARGAIAMPEAVGELDDGERELRLCMGFCSKASARIREALARFAANDDELMKAIADDCTLGRPYPLDAVL
jgi:acyl-CoA dehydrogenase family protein 9